MARPIFEPIFEEDENVIRERTLGRVSDTWRKEPGDFIYDAVVTSSEEVRQLQVNQDTILLNGHPQYAENEDLDLLLAEVGLTRFAATANKRTFNITADAGVTIAAGQIITALITDLDGNPIEFTADAAVTFTTATTKALNATATLLGTGGNLAVGTEFTLVPPIPGVRVIDDLGTYLLGTDVEDDESAWNRYSFKVQNPDTGGNKNDYKRWTLEVAGVGDAKVIPRWNGLGTVKVVIVDTARLPANATIVGNVQNYLDPGSLGMGDGKAPGSAQVTVVAATSLGLTITATVTYYADAVPAEVKTAFTAAVAKYLQDEISFKADTAGNPLPVVIAKIGSLLIGTYGVSNYTLLKLNGGTVDVPLLAEQVPVLGTVTI